MPQTPANTSPRVDAYIAKSADFAQPILSQIRRLFHKASPKIEETIKWGVPHFEHNGLVGGMAAFKHHVSFGLWKGKFLNDPQGILGDAKASMCTVKAKTVSELPADKILIAFIKEAVKLNEHDAKSPKPKVKKTAKKKLVVPAYFLSALKKNKKAFATFEAFTPGKRKEYVEWVTTPKQEATRKTRLATAVQWMAEGKPKNWKYMKC